VVPTVIGQSVQTKQSVKNGRVGRGLPKIELVISDREEEDLQIGSMPSKFCTFG